MILVDTDIMIDILRGHSPAVTWLQAMANERIVVPGFVIMELLQGCRNKAEQQRIEQILNYYAVIWPTPAVCQDALSVFSQYHLSHNFGLLDALIGQTAVAFGLPLHTFNQKHYAAIPGLMMVQPYTR